MYVFTLFRENSNTDIFFSANATSSHNKSVIEIEERKGVINTQILKAPMLYCTNIFSIIFKKLCVFRNFANQPFTQKILFNCVLAKLVFLKEPLQAYP